MIPVPHLPRWQQYLLLAGSVVAALAFVCLRREGHNLVPSLVPLVLPCMLWWPQPATIAQRLYWWLMVLLFFGAYIGLISTCLPY